MSSDLKGSANPLPTARLLGSSVTTSPCELVPGVSFASFIAAGVCLALWELDSELSESSGIFGKYGLTSSL